ncbi:MAG TPA: MFS transporter [Tepidisphaeraceae bacterium]|jgi:MFS family permease
MNTESKPAKISRNVLILGWVSLFNDAASEMLYPIMPLFITATLGASPAILGLVDGAAEGIGASLRWIGGVLSDRLRKRKIFVFLGYAISAFSKPVMGLSAFVGGWPIFMAGRCTDRLGKAARNAPRDALIAASAPEESRGWAFGFQRAMDTVGAVIGPLVALAVIVALTSWHTAFSAAWKQGSDALKNLPLKWLFFVALIPGIAAMLCVSFVKEIPPQGKTKTGGKPPPIFQAYPKRLWMLIGAVFIFSLGNSSDTFLILRSSQAGLTFGWIVLLYAMYNVVYAAVAGPAGKLSDAIGRKPLLIAGWLVYALVYAAFAVLHVSWFPWLFLPIYGLYQGLTDGVTSALISDTVPDEKRAGAIGLFYTLTGLGQFSASLIAGSVYHILIFHGMIHLPFAIGSVCALVAILSLAFQPQGKA